MGMKLLLVAIVAAITKKDFPSNDPAESLEGSVEWDTVQHQHKKNKAGAWSLDYKGAEQAVKAWAIHFGHLNMKNLDMYHNKAFPKAWKEVQSKVDADGLLAEKDYGELKQD